MIPNWTFNQVTFPGIMWARYGQALGLEKLQQVFGANWPPADSRPGETVWAVNDWNEDRKLYTLANNPMGWLSLTQDQFNPKHYYMSRGVWPNQHGKGVGRVMRAFAVDHVLSQGGDSLSIEVSTEYNQEHYENVRRDEFWRPTAMIFEPKSIRFTHTVLSF